MAKIPTDNMGLILGDDVGTDTCLPDFQTNLNKIGNADKQRQADAKGATIQTQLQALLDATLTAIKTVSSSAVKVTDISGSTW